MLHSGAVVVHTISDITRVGVARSHDLFFVCPVFYINPTTFFISFIRVSTPPPGGRCHPGRSPLVKPLQTMAAAELQWCNKCSGSVSCDHHGY